MIVFDEVGLIGDRCCSRDLNSQSVKVCLTSPDLFTFLPEISFLSITPHRMKIAIEGCAHGELEQIYDTIDYIQKKENIKVRGKLKKAGWDIWAIFGGRYLCT